MIDAQAHVTFQVRAQLFLSWGIRCLLSVYSALLHLRQICGYCQYHWLLFSCARPDLKEAEGRKGVQEKHTVTITQLLFRLQVGSHDELIEFEKSKHVHHSIKKKCQSKPKHYKKNSTWLVFLFLLFVWFIDCRSRICGIQIKSVLPQLKKRTQGSITDIYFFPPDSHHLFFIENIHQ